MKTPVPESIIEKGVQEVLERSGLDYVSQPAIKGVRPDFLIHLPDGSSVIIEVKGSNYNFTHAKQQVEYYRKLTGAQHSFVVMADIHSHPNAGIISLTDLPETLSNLSKSVRTEKETVSRSLALEYSIEAPKIMAVMPFAAEFDDVYFFAMSYAADSVGAVCVRVDKEKFVGDVVQKIKDDLQSSIAVIADLSRANPNVLYEVGFAHAIPKPTVHICSTPLSKLPFDVKTWNTIPYKKGQVHALKQPFLTDFYSKKFSI